MINGNDVLILHYINKNSRASELKQPFWTDFLYNDNEKSLQRLLDGGYIEYKKDYFTSLNKLKIDELKEILKKDGLKLTGNKNELIERIINTASIENYQEYIKNVHVITNKGLDVVTTTDFILLLHDMNVGYPIDIYNCYLSNKELNTVDLVIKFIESKATYEKEIDSYSNQAFLYSQLSEILIKYNAKDKALFYLLKACFEYLSSDIISYYSTDTLKYFKENIKRIEFYTNKIKILLQANSDLKDKLNGYYSELNKMYILHYFTSEEVESLITVFELKNSYEVDAIINRIYERNEGQGKLLLEESTEQKEKKGFLKSLTKKLLKKGKQC